MEFTKLWAELDSMGVPLPRDPRSVPWNVRDIFAQAYTRNNGRLTYDEFARAILRLAAL